MLTTTQGLELTVAILMDDLQSAKDISLALRSQNIYAHVYQSLEEFWVAGKLQLPDLLIIDVTKMSQGSAQFRNHPAVVDGSLQYAFFSKDSTKILLQSTMGLRPVGYLHADASLGLQVTTLTRHLDTQKKLEQGLTESKAKVERVSSRTQRILSERSQAEEFRANFDFVQKISSDIEADAKSTDFTQSLMNKLEAWDGIVSYGIFELNPSGQKLISPEISRKKFHPFPSLWLGQENLFGIEEFAQDMALQVAGDLFDIAPVMLKITGGHNLPELLLFVSFTEERMINFPWGHLEYSLSSIFRKIKLGKELPQYSSQFLPMWEALDNLDRLQKSTFDGDTKVIALSFIPLTDVIKKRNQNKFFWSSFFNDFFLQLSGRLQKSTKLSLFGPWHVMFFVPTEELEREIQTLKSFVKQFGFWKFFEDNSQVLSEEMLPELKLIPASSSYYLRSFEKEFADLEAQEEEKRLIMKPRKGQRSLTI